MEDKVEDKVEIKFKIEVEVEDESHPMSQIGIFIIDCYQSTRSRSNPLMDIFSIPTSCCTGNVQLRKVGKYGIKW